jgi:hypothetical protein
VCSDVGENAAPRGDVFGGNPGCEGGIELSVDDRERYEHKEKEKRFHGDCDGWGGLVRVGEV